MEYGEECCEECCENVVRNVVRIVVRNVARNVAVNVAVSVWLFCCKEAPASLEARFTADRSTCSNKTMLFRKE